MPTAPTAPTPGMPDASASAGAGLGVSTGAPATPAGPKPPENPDEKGKFTAGGQLRFPNGPDTTGKYATLNWVAVDAKGRYNPTDWLATYINMPIALKKSSLPAGMATTGGPDIFGGITARSEAGYSKTLGIQLTLGFMRGGLGENSFMYSEKMFPYYQGGLQFVTSAGPYFRFKALGLNITTTPSVAFAAGGSSQGGGTALQVPLSAVIKVGSLVELAADTGIFTAPGLSFDANKGAQMYTGGSLTVKIFKIVVHAGAGVASLFTGPMAPYSSIGQSVYFDLNVKYAK